MKAVLETQKISNIPITFSSWVGLYSTIVYSLISHNVKPDIPDNDDKYKIGLFHGPIEGSSNDFGYTLQKFSL